MTNTKIKKSQRLLTIGVAPENEIGKPFTPPELYTPMIKLAGKWLIDAGFKYRDIVEVDVKENCLTIRKTNYKLREEQHNNLNVKIYSK